MAGGDLILKVVGTDVAEPYDVATAIADNKPGDTVEVEYYRDDEKLTTEVELGKRPARADAEQPDAPGGGGGSGPPDEGLPFQLP